MYEKTQFPPPNPKALYGVDLQSANEAFHEHLFENVPITQQNPYDRLYEPHFDMENLPVDRAEGIRTRSLSTILGSMVEDDWGMKRFGKADSDKFEEFCRSMSAYGITVEAPNQEELDRGHRIAKGRVDSGTALSYLAGQEYVAGSELRSMTKDAKKHVVVWGGQEPLFISPELIVSAGDTFTDWSGRSANVSKNYELPEGKKVEGTSMDAIQTYAAKYDTQLPELEVAALNMVLRKEGPLFYVNHSTNRTAAAKLRGEPLRFTSIVVYDAR